MSNANDDGIKLFFLGIVTIPLLLGWAVWSLVFWNVNETNKTLESVAKSAKHGLVVHRNDGWDRPIKVTEREFSNAVEYTAHSAGKDGQFNTADDLTYSETDFKKTKMAAEWAGRKAKETTKGFFRGLFQ